MIGIFRSFSIKKDDENVVNVVTIDSNPNVTLRSFHLGQRHRGNKRSPRHVSRISLISSFYIVLELLLNKTIHCLHAFDNIHKKFQTRYTMHNCISRLPYFILNLKYQIFTILSKL